MRGLSLAEAILVLTGAGISIDEARRSRPWWEVETLLDDAIARAYAAELQRDGHPQPGPLVAPDEVPSYVSSLPEVTE